jgi:hypothetical protein
MLQQPRKSKNLFKKIYFSSDLMCFPSVEEIWETQFSVQVKENKEFGFPFSMGVSS